MKNSILFFLSVIILLAGSSCMVTRTTIGDGPVVTNGPAVVYSKAKQFYLFWGLFPLGHSQPAIPDNHNLQVKTSLNLTDALVSGLTVGIITSQTIKIVVKRQN